MTAYLAELNALLVVARSRGFRDAARISGTSASTLSEAVSRLEAQLGVRLLHRTTRSVAPTEAGAELIERLGPALGEVELALAGLNRWREHPAGTLRLNVPAMAARFVLPKILPGFLATHPDIQVEIVAKDRITDLVASGCDAGIRLYTRLDKQMIAVPIGPRTHRLVAAAAPAYLDRHGRPEHPRELVAHACLYARHSNGELATPWEFERMEEKVRVEPRGPLVVNLDIGVDLAIDAAIAGNGVVYLFEDWVRSHLDSGTLEPILSEWWPSLPGSYLYYSGRQLVPAPLRAFLDYIKTLR